MRDANSITITQDRFEGVTLGLRKRFLEHLYKTALAVFTSYITKTFRMYLHTYLSKEMASSTRLYTFRVAFELKSGLATIFNGS